MSGTFKTTPLRPLHNLVRILPISLTLTKLRGSYADRLVRLPSNVLPHTLLLQNRVVFWPNFFSCLTPLSSLLEVLPTQLTFTFPAHPSQPVWVHPQCRNLALANPTEEYNLAVRTLIRAQPPTFNFYLYIFNLSVPHPDGLFSAGSLLFKRGVLWASGWESDRDQRASMFLALRAGPRYDLFGLVSVFLPQGDLLPRLFNLRKHRYLSFSSSITSQISTFLSANPAHALDFYRFKKSWKGLPGPSELEHLRTLAQDSPVRCPSAPLSRSQQAWLAYSNIYHEDIQPPPHRRMGILHHPHHSQFH